MLKIVVPTSTRSVRAVFEHESPIVVFKMVEPVKAST